MALNRIAGTTIAALAKGAVLFGVAMLGQAVAIVMLAAIMLSFGLGMVFLFPSAVRLVRGMTGLNRRLAREWSGVEIEAPYQPAPPPPVPYADGWYREGRNLYKTPRIPAFNRRFNWMLKDPATWRDFAYLLADPWSGAMAAAAPVLIVALGVVQFATGTGLLWPVLALLALATAPWVAPWGVRIHGRFAHALLTPTEKARLTRRVDQLARTRGEVVDSQAAELRRIERDLHDGAQARLVAIGMTIGAAEQLVGSDPNAAKALLAKAREASATALHELRQVVRGIHPPVLAERGLGDAVRALALDSPMRTHVTVDLPTRPQAPVESAAYFAISELLTNAVRHGEATEAWIDISHREGNLRVSVTDNGHGGADPARGTGLNGIERRMAAFDGVLALNSPAGGPTTAVLELPRALGTARAPHPAWKSVTIAVGWTLAAVPTFPQGFVPMVIKLTGNGETGKSWFLALHLPESFQWPVIAGMIALGGAMYTAAALLTAQAKRAEEGEGCG
ncbi:sensor histidine kinase [Sphaerimonospora thailandensis]|uniref:histidine kinase n=1 Tax=Sphaerimonospora thailandensis TaxID=795644 RepID=A0A8J3R8A9_9ACTN|nr:histidine kinase [Sphaerimonospora thailandensis]GIH71186.1 histidine kinase [Sphaerimonospora thailandensis]